MNKLEDPCSYSPDFELKLGDEVELGNRVSGKVTLVIPEHHIFILDGMVPNRYERVVKVNGNLVNKSIMKELKVLTDDKVELFDGTIGSITNINFKDKSISIDSKGPYQLSDIKIINHLPASGFKLKI